MRGTEGQTCGQEIQLQFTGGSRREVHKGMPVVVNAFGRGDVFKESLEIKVP